MRTFKKKSLKKIKKKVLVRWGLVYFVMLALVLFMSLPLIYMVATALKPLNELYLFPPTFLTKAPTLQNFRQLFVSASDGTIPLTRHLFNSVVSTGFTVFFSVIICSMGAYSLEKLRPPGHEAFFKAIIVGLMFVPPVAQIPIYIVMSKLNLLKRRLFIYSVQLWIVYTIEIHPLVVICMGLTVIIFL